MFLYWSVATAPDAAPPFVSSFLVAPGSFVCASNVMLSLLHKLGHDDLQSFGDSEGTFAWE